MITLLTLLSTAYRSRPSLPLLAVEKVVVGDIDTGIDYNHPDLAANVDFARSVSCIGGAPSTTS